MKLYMVMMVLFIFICKCLYAFEDNILLNPELKFESPDSNSIPGWKIETKDKIERKEIVAFKGEPWNLYYVTGKDASRIVQSDIPVKEKSWYVLSAWYKGDLSVHPAGNFWLAAGNPEKGIYERLGCIYIGSSSEWINVKSFINTGDINKIRFQTHIFGAGNWAVGKFQMSRVSETDLNGPFLCDGDFEKGIAGRIPVDFHNMNDKIISTVSEDGNFLNGKKSMKVEIPQNLSLDIRGPQIPIKGDGRVKFSFWAKSDTPDTDIEVVLLRPGGSLALSSHFALKKEWKRYTVENYIPPVKDNDLQIIHLIFRSKPQNENTCLWFDEMSLDIEKRPVKTAIGSKNSKNLLMNSSFEAAMIGWDYRTIRNTINEGKNYEPSFVSIDETASKEGACSLHIYVPDTSAKASAEVYSAFFLANAHEKYTVSFWAKSDRDASVEVSLTPIFRRYGKMVSICSRDWQRYTVSILPETDQKGEMALWLIFPKGNYWLDALQIEKGDNAGEYEAKPPIEVGATINKLHSWYFKGEKPEATVYMRSRLKDERKMKVECIVKNWLDAEVYSAEKTVLVSPSQLNKEAFSLPNDKYGAFKVLFRLTDSVSNISEESFAIYGVFPRPKDINPENSFFGVHDNELLAYNGASIMRGGTLSDSFKLARMCGARWNRSFMLGSWLLHEPEQNKWQWCDTFVNTSLENGIKQLPCLGPLFYYAPLSAPVWADSDKVIPHEPHFGKNPAYYPKMELWEKFLKEFVKHYGDRIDTVEILNETGGCEQGMYVELLKSGFKAIKSISPDTRVLGPAYPSQGIPYDEKDDSWIGKVMKMGAYNWIDVYSAHFYAPSQATPTGTAKLENFINEHGALEKTLNERISFFRKHYGNKEIWDTEWGINGNYQLQWMRRPELEATNYSATPKYQAERYVRWLTIKLAAGIKKAFYHNFYNGPIKHQGGKELIEPTWDPKPVTIAAAQVARMIDGGVFIKKIVIDKSTWTYIFNVDNVLVAIYWNIDDNDKGKFSLACSKDNVIVQDLMGNDISPVTEKENIILPLSGSPAYVISKNLSLERFSSIFESAEVKGVVNCSLFLTLDSPQSTPSIAIECNNASSTKLTASAKLVNIPKNWKAGTETIDFRGIPGNQKVLKYIPVEIFPFTGEPQEISAAGKVENYDLRLKASRTFKISQAVCIEKPICLDGKITDAEYGNAPAYELSSPDKSFNAKFRFAWNQKNLFAGIQVKDSKVVSKAPSNELYKEDCIEIYLDTAPSENLSADVYQDHQGKLFCSPDGRLSNRIVKNGIRKIAMKDVKMKSSVTEDGYVIEVIIPLSANEKFTKGTIWGLDFSAIDFNSKDRLQFIWCGKTPWDNPHEFGFIVLN